MNITIQPGRLRGTVNVPPSKSMAHRALIAAALADRPTVIHIRRLNDDIEATIAALTALGATIERDSEQGLLTVRPLGTIDQQPLTLDCGESGSTLRFLLPVACALGATATFTGRGRLPSRPNAALTLVLRAHGANIDRDALPIAVSGKLCGGEWELPGDISSQYVTGLLFALPLLREDSEITLTTPLQSADYVEMTLDALKTFGIVIEKREQGYIVPGGQRYISSGDMTIEGDWSAAAFWFAANALGSDIDVAGVSKDSAQGDRAVLELLGQPEIDATHVPDLVPALAAVAAALPGRTTITGAARLRLKESDRLKAVADMVNALGGHVEVTADGLIIDGGAVHGGTVDGCNDHRIVMAAAILATVADGPVTIIGAEAVSKSYPDFFEHLKEMNGSVGRN